MANRTLKVPWTPAIAADFKAFHGPNYTKEPEFPVRKTKFNIGDIVQFFYPLFPDPLTHLIEDIAYNKGDQLWYYHYRVLDTNLTHSCPVVELDSRDDTSQVA